ncbi:hypothetical protein CBER1_10966 [Cercospora berteroae]|uniref:Uncharacterized protein n=1 Tax=Cercospora berteroae TaxID=357750 RepID=A0A2S6CMF1_9PEZI|nr:hypothetical protein CBER1_10966 [Cercospora berteroae]
MNKRIPNDRIFDVLGSTDNTNGLIIADDEINAVKTRIWQGIKPQASHKLEKYVRDWIDKGEKPDPFLRALRATRAVFSYMDISEVEEKWRDLVQYVDQQLEIIVVIPAFARIEWGWSDFLSGRFLEDRSIKARDWMRVSIEYAYTPIEKAMKNKKKIDDLDEVVDILEALEKSIDDDMWLYVD